MNKILLLLFCLAFSLKASYIKKEFDTHMIYETTSKFSQVIFILKDEIAQNGFLLSYEADIKNSMDAINSFYKKENAFIDAQVIGFCKGSLSVKMMEENPLNIMYCPLNIVVFQENKKDAKVKVLYKLKKPIDENDKVYKTINKQLIKIIENSLSY